MVRNSHCVYTSCQHIGSLAKLTAVRFYAIMDEDDRESSFSVKLHNLLLSDNIVNTVKLFDVSEALF